MGGRPQPVFPRVTTDDAPRLAAELFVEHIFGIPGEETLDLNEARDRSERITFVPTRKPNTVLISNGFAAMGFGLPAAMAAALWSWTFL
jgi:thiamine pyrophosphate-dependent acetolactate synthase large subunit-like protein